MTASAQSRFATPQAARVAWSEVGDEPAIEADGKRHSPDERARVSIRWLLGTSLTGLSGAMLISSAAYTALDQQTKFAESPTRAQVVRREDRDSQIVNPKKGDRLLRAVDVIAAKQTFRTATTVKSGDKEVVRTKAFTRVATTLTLSQTAFADDVPPFNPFKLTIDPHYAQDNLNESDIPPDQAEVSFVTRDLAALSIERHAAALSLEESHAQVVEQSKSTLTAGGKAPPPLPGQALLSRTVRPAIEPLPLGYAPSGAEPTTLSAPFSQIEVRMAPVNVTVAPRVTAQPTQMEEKVAIVRRGEDLSDVLATNGVPRSRIPGVLAAYRGKRGEPAREGQQVKLLFADFDGSGRDMQLARVSIYTEEKLDSLVAVTDGGAFQQVAAATAGGAKPRAATKTRVGDADLDGSDEPDDPNGMRLYDSIYETALKQDVPKPIIGELVRVFANDVDLQRGVSGGDSLNLFYEENDENSGRDSLLFAQLTARGETYRYYRFQTPDDGLVDYYDENGRSSRKFLVRKPIAAGETRSGFGMRRHPILGYYKMHTGVDWAAPIGTPIFAAGNGVVIKAQWDAGYGRRVEIQHANGYVTTYNHMSGFARGIGEGVRVKQGQTVGFLGSTGLSTGPHLHYEVMVNSHFVDPMRVKLARTREFDGKQLAEFRRERERIEQLMAKAPNNPKIAAHK